MNFLGTVLLTVAGMEMVAPAPKPVCELEKGPWAVTASVELLQERLPPGVQVEVGYEPALEPYLGVTYDLEDGSYLILIDSDLSVEAQWVVLIHEWAHVLAGVEGQHDDPWGIEQARVYRMLVGLE